MNTVEAVIEKKGIPLKSKLAAWWMLIVGGTIGAIGLALFLRMFTVDPEASDMFDFVLFLFSLIGIGIFIVYFLSGLLVLKGGRWGWMIASAILFVAVATVLVLFFIGHSLSPLFLIPPLIPLTLILLDHISYKLVALLDILIVTIYFGGLVIASV